MLSVLSVARRVYESMIQLDVLLFPGSLVRLVILVLGGYVRFMCFCSRVWLRIFVKASAGLFCPGIFFSTMDPFGMRSAR